MWRQPSSPPSPNISPYYKETSCDNTVFRKQFAIVLLYTLHYNIAHFFLLFFTGLSGVLRLICRTKSKNIWNKLWISYTMIDIHYNMYITSKSEDRKMETNRCCEVDLITRYTHNVIAYCCSSPYLALSCLSAALSHRKSKNDKNMKRWKIKQNEKIKVSLPEVH